MRRVSLDTPNEVLWAPRSELIRVMQDRPTPSDQRVTTVRTPNGNLVSPRHA